VFASVSLLGTATVMATEADLKADQATDADGKNAAVPARPDTSVCEDETAELTLDVNTLEDIFSASRANLRAILEEPEDEGNALKPASDEVQWQAVENGVDHTPKKTAPAKNAKKKSDKD
jgi:hypothetical protein